MTPFHSQLELRPPPPDNVTLPQFLLDQTRVHPSRPTRPPATPWLIDGKTGRQILQNEVVVLTDALARSLQARWNVGNDDVVALYIPNHIYFPICLWALHRLGAIAAMTSPALTSSELVYQLEIAQPRLLITHSDGLANALEAVRTLNLGYDHVIVIDAPPSAPLPDAVTRIEDIIGSCTSTGSYREFRLQDGEAKTKVAVLCYSSGTTGKPKAAAVSHYNFICNIIQMAVTMRVNEDYAPAEEKRYKSGDVCAAVLPLYHMYGNLASLHFTLYCGMSIVIMEKYNHEDLLCSIERFRINHLFLVPSQVVLFCKHPSTRKYNLSSVRTCMVAAAPLSAELTSQLLDVMPHIHLGQGYGMTEATAAVSLWPLSQRVGTLGSCGHLVAGTSAKIVKPDGSLASVGEPGELWVKGGQVVLGYYRNAAATRDTFLADGWIRTGDQLVRQESGDLFVVDRVKELIKVRAKQVAPAELEGHLLAHPAVADVGVVGVPDDYSGEVPLAFVVLHPHLRANIEVDRERARELRESIYNHVAHSKSREKWLAGGIVLVDEIPKTASGKILRRVLREWAAANTGASRNMNVPHGFNSKL